MYGTVRHHLLKGLIAAWVVALLASAGGNWGTAFGQTAPPPPTRAPGEPTRPAVAPPSAAQYRPAPQDDRATGGNPATVATAPSAVPASPPVPTASGPKAAPAVAASPGTSPPAPEGASADAQHQTTSLTSGPLLLFGGVAVLLVALFGVRRRKS